MVSIQTAPRGRKSRAFRGKATDTKVQWLAPRTVGHRRFLSDARPLLAVVDDDESVRESLPELLRELGFDVVAFSSAEAFLTSDAARLTQCLLLDVNMS